MTFLKFVRILHFIFHFQYFIQDQYEPRRVSVQSIYLPNLPPISHFDLGKLRDLRVYIIRSALSHPSCPLLSPPGHNTFPPLVHRLKRADLRSRLPYTYTPLHPARLSKKSGAASC